jgi:hypothetical protein
LFFLLRNACCAAAARFERFRAVSEVCPVDEAGFMVCIFNQEGGFEGEVCPVDGAGFMV